MIITGTLAAGAAQAATKSSGSSLQPLILIAIVGLGMYLLVLRPQRTRARRAQELQADLVPGQTVMTAGGMFATVAAVDGDAVLLEIAPGVTTRWARAAIGRVVPTEELVGEPATDADAGTTGDRGDAAGRPDSADSAG